MNGHDDRTDRDDAQRAATDRALRDYRAAADALEERPSAHTRAAILAAAAREAGAQPRDAAAGTPLPRRGRTALRWPMAAAATVLLSSLAVMMASRVEQESQTVTEAAAPPVASAAPSTAAVSEDTRTTDAVPGARPPAVDAAPPPAADAAAEKPVTAPPGAASSRTAPPITAPRREAQPASREARSEAPAPPPPPFAEAPRERSAAQLEPRLPAPPPASPAPVAPAPAAAAPQIAQPAEQAAAADSAAASKPEPGFISKEISRSRARGETAPAAGLRGDAAQAASEAEESTLSANDWLARIVRLRGAGQHAEADAQLQRFRLRYPQVKVPEQALPPAGTR